MKSALIVEPSERIGRQVLSLLGRSGWQVDHVCRIDQALKFLQQPARDLVYINEATDYDTGYRLVSAVRHEPRWRTARVLVAGVGDERIHGPLAREMGADDYVTVPCTVTRMLSKLRCLPCGTCRVLNECLAGSRLQTDHVQPARRLVRLTVSATSVACSAP